MAFQDLAARSGTVLVDGDERLVLVPAHRGDGAAAVAAAAADKQAAVVVYKGGSRLPELAATLARAGRLEGAVLGELLGLPGGRVAAVADVADRPATYLATLVVPPVR
jgi:precorrin-2/cobalt-factor-2 C20-methyltransferase